MIRVRSRACCTDPVKNLRQKAALRMATPLCVTSARYFLQILKVAPRTAEGTSWRFFKCNAATPITPPIGSS